jgi:hypothetical protein
MNNSKPWCDIFVTEDELEQSLYKISIQTTHFNLFLTATDLSFARRTLDFIAETKGNALYRDTPVGGGEYRYMPEKSVDLSSSFRNTTLKFQKLGSSDCAYLVRAAAAEISLCFEMWDELLEAFANGLQGIIDDYYPKDKAAQ